MNGRTRPWGARRRSETPPRTALAVEAMSVRLRDRQVGLITAAALVAWASSASRSYLVVHEGGVLGRRSLQAAPEASSGDQASDVATWVLAVLAATVTKLTSSIDDICWLLPFVAGTDRRTNLYRAGQYVVTMVGVAGAASGVATAGDQAIASLVDENSEWSSQRLLSLAAGILLTFYTIKLFREWLEERRSSDEETAPPAVELQVTEEEQTPWADPTKTAQEEVATAATAPASTTAAAAAPTTQTSTRRLLVVSLMGSMDDFAVFISLMLARTFSAPQLMLGVALGSMLVTAFCLFASLFEPVVRVISTIPLFAIIGAFATYTFVEAFA